MKKNVKIIGGSALGVIVAVAILLSALAPLSVETIELQATTARVTFTEQGVLQYKNVREVYPVLSGELLELVVDAGDKVVEGDPLAVISAKDVEYEIARLQSSIKGYNAQIYNLALQEQQEKEALAGTKNNLLGQLAALDAQISGWDGAGESRQRQIILQEEIVARDSGNVHLARSNLRNFREEYDAGDFDTDYGYDAEYNALREALNIAEKALAASELQLEQLKDTNAPGYFKGQRESLQAQINSIDARLGKNYTAAMQSYYSAMIEIADASLQQLVEQKGDATVPAPMSGIVAELPAKAGAIVNPGIRIASVGTDPMVEVFVPIREIDAVKIGDKVELILDKRLGDESFSGTIALVEDHAQIRLSALGVEERKVRVLIRPSAAGIGVGFNMDVKFTVLEQQDCVIVPKAAVFDDEGQDMVWTVENGAARLRAIEKGIETREGYVVDSGLSAGDEVILDANNVDLTDGKRVAAAGKD